MLINWQRELFNEYSVQTNQHSFIFAKFVYVNKMCINLVILILNLRFDFTLSNEISI